MKLEKYPLTSGDRQTTFEFISEGYKGLIHKLVRYQPTDKENVYNLAFGDKNRITGIIDDTVITNNGDGEKVLSTVAATVYAFTDKYPDAWTLRQEAQKREPDFTEWESPDSYPKFETILMSSDCGMATGSPSWKM